MFLIVTEVPNILLTIGIVECAIMFLVVLVCAITAIPLGENVRSRPISLPMLPFAFIAVS